MFLFEINLGNGTFLLMKNKNVTQNYNFHNLSVQPHVKNEIYGVMKLKHLPIMVCWNVHNFSAHLFL